MPLPQISRFRTHTTPAFCARSFTLNYLANFLPSFCCRACRIFVRRRWDIGQGAIFPADSAGVRDARGECVIGEFSRWDLEELVAKSRGPTWIYALWMPARSCSSFIGSLYSYVVAFHRRFWQIRAGRLPVMVAKLDGLSKHDQRGTLTIVFDVLMSYKNAGN